jgi:hypothetical protein
MSVGKKPRKPIPRYTEIKRSRLRPKKRSAADFARIYGSQERVRWVKSLPCCGCGRLPTDDAQTENAHTVSGGKGRKADAATIAPLCHGCHMRYDRHLPPFNAEPARELVKVAAFATYAQWERMGGLEPVSSIVPRVVARITGEDAE